MCSQKLYDGGSTSQVDFWFVHGLGGHPIHTWSKGSVCWPRDLLYQDLPNCRIYTWGYDSSVFHSNTQTSHASIFGHVENLLLDISGTRQSDEERERPIIFVGHSLGGLVIKQALIRSSEIHRGEPDSGEALVYPSTKGIIFFGTPHRGSDLVPYGKMVVTIAKLAFRNPNKKHLELLQRNSQIMENQRSSFDSIRKNLQLVCVIEELETTLGMVVSLDSGMIDGLNVKKVMRHANHMDMCKYADREGEYNRIVLAIQRLIPRELQRPARQEEIIDDMTCDLLFRLKFDSMDIREADIDDAHRDTFQWIVEPDPIGCHKRSPFIDWLESEQRIFWLSGKPGSGKSTLMKLMATSKALSDRLKTNFPEKRWIVASHYLLERGEDPLQKSREGLIRHLLCQIISQFPEAAQIALNRSNSGCTSDGQRPLSWKQLQDILHVIMAKKRSDVGILCFIDGLDEYRPIEGLETVDSGNKTEARDNLISKGHQEIVQLVLDIAKYPNVRLCVSSRPLLVIRDALGDFRNAKLDDLTYDDISKYVTYHLSKNGILNDLDILTPNFRDDIVHEILAKASGVFLWVKLVLDIIIGRLTLRDNPSELLERLRRMPERLGGKDGLYMNMLRNLSSHDLRDSYKYFQAVLKSKHDMDPQVLFFLTNDRDIVLDTQIQQSRGDMANTRRRYVQDRVLGRCGGLLEVHVHFGESRINFIHQTAKEFVEDSQNWKHLLPEADDLTFDGTLGLMMASIQMIKHTDTRTGGMYGPNYKRTWVQLRSCLEYARQHEEDTGMTDSELILLLDKVMVDFCQPNLLFDEISNTLQHVDPFDDLVSSDNRHLIPLRPLSPQIGSADTLSQSIASRHWSIWEPSMWYIPRDKDLIAIAIQSNLCLFLEQLHKNGALRTHSERHYPLLAYALVPYRVAYSHADGYSRLGRYQSVPEVTRILLKNGHDPNQEYDGPAYQQHCTVWQGFLTYGDLMSAEFLMSNHEFPREHYQNWFENAQVLLNSSVDVNAPCLIKEDSKVRVATPYHKHSALFTVARAVWRLAKDNKLHMGVLEKMVEKGAVLKRGEKERLYDQASQLKIPEQFKKRVINLVREVPL
ncbi:hypothetical protein F4818DRAFT_423753 [Hypoxylon cercidicola]|nr:hypothetical protein F4818DRAFT_423753 [Hypoxylon cercidicola]